MNEQAIMIAQHELAFQIAWIVFIASLPMTYLALFIAIIIADRREQRPVSRLWLR